MNGKRSPIIRVLAASLLLAAASGIAAATPAQAATRCGSSQQWAFNDQWLGTFCIGYTTAGKLTTVGMSGAVNGFPNFSGCQVKARWWTPGNVQNYTTGYMTCSSFVSQRYGTYTWTYPTALNVGTGVQVCGTFIFNNANTGQYWGPAQAVCVTS